MFMVSARNALDCKIADPTIHPSAGTPQYPGNYHFVFVLIGPRAATWKDTEFTVIESFIHRILANEERFKRFVHVCVHISQ